MAGSSSWRASSTPSGGTPRASRSAGPSSSWPWAAARNRRSRSSGPCGRSARTSSTWRSTRIPRERPRRPAPLAAHGRPGSTSRSSRCRRTARIPTRSSPATGPAEGATRLFRLDHAEPGAAWLARSQLARCPPVTFEAAARLRVLSAETVRAMPASSRPGYAAALAQALGLSIGALMEEWIRHAAEARARMVREHLRRWVSEWVGRLDRGSLSEHLDEATRVLAAARTDLSGPEMTDVGATELPGACSFTADRGASVPGESRPWRVTAGRSRPGVALPGPSPSAPGS